MKGGMTIFTRIFIAFLLLAILPVMISSLLVVATYDELLIEFAQVLELAEDPIIQGQSYSLTRDATVLVAMTILITVVLAVFASLYISRSLGMPIHRLLAAIQETARGNLEVRVPVRSMDELGQLGRGFNQMVRRLEQFQRDLEAANELLEHRVAERTAELRLAYEELEASAEKIREANRLKTEFVANMSHELRTPLNAIMGYTELVMEGIYGDLGEKQREVMAKIQRNSRQLLRLITEVLDLAKIDAGKMEMYLETFDLMELIRSVADGLRPLFERKDVNLIVRSQGHVPTVEQDLGKIQQILVNLLSNALKFTPAGSVTVVAREEPSMRRVCIEVIDTGVGIPEGQSDVIFEQFHQLDGGTARQQGGTGLGLALVKQLVKMIGGTVTLISKVGKGSVFTVRFPVRYQPHDEKEHAVGPALPVILAVDDDEAALADLGRALEGEAFAIVRCTDGQDAIHKARTVNPRLILLDVLMPSQDGWSVLKILKGDPVTKPIPVIMMGKRELSPTGERESFNGFLTKPFSREALLDVIGELIG